MHLFCLLVNACVCVLSFCGGGGVCLYVETYQQHRGTTLRPPPRGDVQGALAVPVSQRGVGAGLFFWVIFLLWVCDININQIPPSCQPFIHVQISPHTSISSRTACVRPKWAAHLINSFHSHYENGPVSPSISQHQCSVLRTHIHIHIHEYTHAYLYINRRTTAPCASSRWS